MRIVANRAQGKICDGNGKIHPPHFPFPHFSDGRSERKKRRKFFPLSPLDKKSSRRRPFPTPVSTRPLGSVRTAETGRFGQAEAEGGGRWKKHSGNKASKGVRTAKARLSTEHGKRVCGKPTKRRDGRRGKTAGQAGKGRRRGQRKAR